MARAKTSLGPAKIALQLVTLASTPPHGSGCTQSNLMATEYWPVLMRESFSTGKIENLIFFAFDLRQVEE